MLQPRSFNKKSSYAHLKRVALPQYAHIKRVAMPQYGTYIKRVAMPQCGS
jgi:hypothetical protein